ncbi:unnamed protein product [Candidula unifasciata]|uniref:Alpha-macroglobulin receptor-binding domain-containing protein n=1 Tax=Candidula unifasciata TaxID=100452 RepID=A0A8S3ZDP5_9EUPU|nr:unnamed protein product [Candidula unifasciata]
MLENIQDLLRQPYGCGEQNMLNFAPSVFMTRYFLDTGTEKPELIQRAIGYIETGYQTELTYMHKTGGFSAFGEQDKIASTWLSAFVLNCIAQASSLNEEFNNILQINVTDVMSVTLRFLISKQNPNGSFTEDGKVFHKEMQGGSAEGEALTAYTLISLIEAAKTVKGNTTFAAEVCYIIQKSISQAAEYLAGRIDALKDPFDLCITSYALHLLGHPLKDSIFSKVEALAQNGDSLKFWKRSSSLQDAYAGYAWSASADSIAIEMTSYCLLVYSIRGIEVTQGLPIIRWLTNQRGPNSGFVSTQVQIFFFSILNLNTGYDEVAQAWKLLCDVTVSYVDGEGQSQSSLVHINKGSEMLLQKVYIDCKKKAPTSLFLTANTDDGQPGPSTILLVVSLDFNVKEEPLALCYNTSHTVTKTADSLTLTINVAAVTNNVTSMSILAVQIPAGYTILVEEVGQNDNVSRVDPFNGDTVFIYYDSGVINTKGLTATIKMYKTNDALTDAKPRSYTISDYYQTNCKQTKTYTWSRDHICVTVPDNGICRYVTV